MQSRQIEESQTQSIINRKNFTKAIGSNSVRLRSHSDTDFVIEISRKREIIIHPTLKKKVSFTEYQQTVVVEISPCYKTNQSKGMIYIREFNTTDIEEYSEQLKNILTC